MFSKKLFERLLQRLGKTQYIYIYIGYLYFMCLQPMMITFNTYIYTILAGGLELGVFSIYWENNPN